MKAAELIDRARALADAHPEETRFVDQLVEAIERIEREFRGPARDELLGEAHEALERQQQLVRNHHANLHALDRLRESQRELDQALEKLKALVVSRPKGVTLH